MYRDPFLFICVLLLMASALKLRPAANAIRIYGTAIQVI
jgi:hypothetical protein